MRTVRFWNFPNQVGSKKKDHSYKNKKNYTSNGEDGEREFNQNLSIHFQWQPKKNRTNHMQDKQILQHILACTRV